MVIILNLNLEIMLTIRKEDFIAILNTIQVCMDKDSDVTRRVVRKPYSTIPLPLRFAAAVEESRKVRQDHGDENQ